MFKPRIKLCGLMSNPEYRWICRGFGCTGRGGTPQAAYEKWRETRRWSKGYGIGRAREARMAREKRIRDREERRAAARQRRQDDDVVAEARRTYVPTFWERLIFK